MAEQWPGANRTGRLLQAARMEAGARQWPAEPQPGRRRTPQPNAS